MTKPYWKKIQEQINKHYSAQQDFLATLQPGMNITITFNSGTRQAKITRRNRRGKLMYTSYDVKNNRWVPERVLMAYQMIVPGWQGILVSSWGLKS